MDKLSGFLKGVGLGIISIGLGFSILIFLLMISEIVILVIVVPVLLLAAFFWISRALSGTVRVGYLSTILFLYLSVLFLNRFSFFPEIDGKRSEAYLRDPYSFPHLDQEVYNFHSYLKNPLPLRRAGVDQVLVFEIPKTKIGTLLDSTPPFKNFEKFVIKEVDRIPPSVLNDIINKINYLKHGLNKNQALSFASFSSKARFFQKIYEDADLYTRYIIIDDALKNSDRVFVVCASSEKYR